MGRPWLSVVMPTYNGERYVAAALGSIEREGADDLEVIVVDDGSTDGTLEIVAAFQHRLPLTLVRQEHAVEGVASGADSMATIFVSFPTL